MSNGKNILIELPSGARYGVEDAETAARVYPDATIVGYQDGSLWGGEPLKEITPNLKKMKRDDLDAYAAAKGVKNPAGYPNVDALIAAIEGQDSK